MNFSNIKILVLSGFLLSLTPAMAADFTVGKLQTNNLDNPLGIDDTSPRFSWQMYSGIRDQNQSAYQILVATSIENLNAGIGDMWDSGRIESGVSNNIVYGGLHLSSRNDYFWKVRIWNQTGQTGDWSDIAKFGMAMLSQDDWSARWITMKSEGLQYPQVEIKFDEPVLARYVQINVTELGIPVDEAGKWRLQLSEIEVYGPLDTTKNLAFNCPATMTNVYVSSLWKTANLTDGISYSTGTSPGACTNSYTSSTPTNPVDVKIDLGSEMMVNKIILYARTDIPSRDYANLVGNFPKNYTIQTKITDGTVFTVRKAITNQQTPKMPYESEYSKRLPMLGTSFIITKKVKSAKIYSCGLGLFEMSINRKLATENVLEPGETAYKSTILYTKYDVTDKLLSGKNVIIARMGNGIYNNPPTPGRYQKLNIVYGPIRLLAQLEITYTDGSKQTIITDGNWKAAKSPITFSGWYGGEDYDARLEKSDINNPEFAFDGWEPAVLCTEKSGKLKAQFYEPTAVTETWRAVDVSNPADGIYIVDFGRNFAGQYEFSLKAPAGTAI